jgi:hypothetical protein
MLVPLDTFTSMIAFAALQPYVSRLIMTFEAAGLN